MVLAVDGIEYNNIVVNSLQRSIVVAKGRNGGTFLSGDKFNDVRHSYYRYTLTISPSLRAKEEYEELYAVLGLPVESHEITVPYGQGYKSFEACVVSVSDRCRKKMENGTIWDNFTVVFDGTEAINK